MVLVMFVKRPFRRMCVCVCVVMQSHANHTVHAVDVTQQDVFCHTVDTRAASAFILCLIDPIPMSYFELLKVLLNQGQPDTIYILYTIY